MDLQLTGPRRGWDPTGLHWTWLCLTALREGDLLLKASFHG